MENNFNQLDYLEKELERLLFWIQASESKINIVTTLSIAMLGALAVLFPSPNKWTCISIIFTSFSVAFLLIGLFFTALSLFPRTDGPTQSLIYFGIINNIELQDYRNQVNELDKHNYMDDLISQCHRNAQIATKKYKYVKRSILCLFISFIPWLFSIYLLYNK